MRPDDPDWPLSHLRLWHSISISSPSHTRHSLAENLYTQATPGDLFDPVGYLISNNDLASQFSIRSHSPDIPHIPGATDKDAAQLSRNCEELWTVTVTVRNCEVIPAFLYFSSMAVRSVLLLLVFKIAAWSLLVIYDQPQLYKTHIYIWGGCLFVLDGA